MLKRSLLAGAFVAATAVPAFAQQFSEGYNFLKAVRERDGGTVQTITSNPSSSAINAKDGSTGEGALHILVRGRDLNFLAYLLGRGARPDIQNNEGTTPLAIAAQIGWVEGAERLLAHRASVNAANNRGETPLIYAVQRRNIPMIRLLLSKGADPNQADSIAGYSALDYARQDRRSAAVLRILEETRAPRRNAVGPTR